MPLSNHSIADLRRLLKNAVSLELSAGAAQRLKWFIYCSGHNGNVSLTCRHFGISRSTFLRWSKRFDARNLRSLEEESRRPHAVRSPETDARTIHIITDIRRSEPQIGKSSLQKLLRETYDIVLSTSTIGRIISRHKLFFGDSASHRSKRGETDIDIDTLSVSPRPVAPEQTEAEGDLPFLSEPGLTS